MRQWMAWIAIVWLAGAGVAHAEPSTHSIYRCETPQGLVFSDRPCSSDSQVYEPDLSGVSVVATEVPKTTSSAAVIKPPHRRVSSDRPVAAKADQCQRLHDSLRKIASTMRSGYGAKEGERLKERKRDLEAKRRAQKC
jgi:hypothetical protein